MSLKAADRIVPWVPRMLNFPSDFTHSHHIPGRDSKYDLYFTNGRLGSPKRMTFLRQTGVPPLLTGLSQFFSQSLPERPLWRR